MFRAMIFIVLVAAAKSLWAAPPVAELGQPRALFFRRAEGLAATGRLSFEEWDACFSRLNGLIGKCLDEEVLNRSANVDFFRRFKEEHPEQLLLLHLNGNVRDTSFHIERYSACHWVYFQGCAATSEIPAESGQTRIAVEDPSLFQTGLWKGSSRNDDLAICALDAAGKPDWSRCEQARLVSIDAKGKTLLVQRGAYGSEPLAFAAGAAYIAPHATVPPPAEQGNLRWMYNFSLSAPRDSQGRSCADILVEETSEWFAPGGPCDKLDGIAFDVLFFEARVPRNNTRLIDADGDGRADGGILNGINDYGFGVIAYLEQLRAALGEGRIITADGQDAENQRGFEFLNGMESEGFPVHRDEAIADWSGAINRLFFWRDNGREPRFSYVLHKYQEGKQGDWIPPYTTTRLVLAVPALADVTLALGIAPPANPDELHGIWDETVAGLERRPNWLGHPAGPLVRLARQAPDLVQGAPLERWLSEDAMLAAEGAALAIRSKTPAAETMRVRLRGADFKGPDLTVFMTVQAEPQPNWPRPIPRVLWARLEREGGAASDPQRALFHAEPLMAFAGAQPFEAAFCFRGLDPGRFDLALEIEGGAPLRISNVSVHNAPDAMAREFEHGAVLVNPSLEPFEFDLNALFPGKAFLRLQGSPNQDPEANSGQPVGGKAVLQGRDGLFLRLAPRS